MNKKLFFQLILSFVLFVSCSKNESLESKQEPVLVDQLPEDFLVPQMIWDSTKPKLPEGKEKPILYTFLKVAFKEKNKGVLKNSLSAYEFTRGGGEIDLSSVIAGKPGTFFLNFELPEFENALQKKAFFISKSRQRKVDGEILGSGCNKVLDISQDFFKKIKEEGIKINTTRDRHVSILGGHLVLLAENEKNWLLTQITFFDTTRSDLFCQDFRSATVKETP